MNHPQQPSDQTPTDPWSDMDVAPVAPEKDRHNAAYLYNNKPSTTSGWGVTMAWVNHPAAVPVVLIGLVVMGIAAFMASREDAAKLAAANAQTQADFTVFVKGLNTAGLERTCLATEPKHVPAQYMQDCQAVRAAAKERGARP